MASSFQPAGLEPIQQTSYGASAQATQQELNTALDPLFQSQQENENRRTQNASIQDNSMEQAFKGFAAMSNTLSSLVQEETKRRKEDRIAELKAAVLEGNYSQDDLTNYQLYKQQTTNEKNKRDEAGAQARLAGASYEATSRIRSLKRWEQEVVVGLLTQQLMAGKEDRLTSRFATDNETLIALPDGTRMTPVQARAEGTPAQQKAMRAILAKEDLKNTGLIGVADHILADKGLEVSMKADINIDAANTRIFNINDSEKVIELARAELRITKDPNLFRKRVLGRETAGGVITSAMANKMLFDEIETLITVGVDENGNEVPALMSNKEYRQILDAVVEGDAKRQTWGERFKPQIRAIENRRATAKLQAYNTKKAQVQMEWDKAQEDAILAIPLEQRNNATLQYVMDELSKDRRFVGLKAEKIERYMADNSVDARQKRAIEESVIRQIENGTWTMAGFRKLPAVLQTDFYKQKAQEGEALIDPQVTKLRDSVLERFITTKTGSLPEKWNHTAEFLQSEFRQMFDVKVKEYYQSGKFTLDGAARQAMKEIEEIYDAAQKNPKSRYFRSPKGFVNLLPTSQQAKTSAAAAVAELKRLDNLIVRGGAAGLGQLAGSYVTKDELVKSSQSFGTAYWRPAGPAAYVADKLGMSVVDVQNIWAKELGAPQLDKSRSETTFDRTISPAAKQYMRRYKESEEIRNRTLNQAGWQSSFVPNEMGETVEQVAQANNIEASLLAAVAEKNGVWDAETVQRLGSQLGLLRQQKGGSINAALASLAGYANADDPDFKNNYLTPVLKTAVKYGGRSVLTDPALMRPGVVYRIGSLGYGSTGPHLDLKRVMPGGTKSTGQSLIASNELDNFVEVQVGGTWKALSKGTTITDDESRHRARGSYGMDYAAPSGTPVRLKNGARVVDSFQGDEGTDHLIIELPNGQRFQFLHGKKT